MQRILTIAVLLAGGLMADTAHTIPFRVVLSSDNEIPAVAGAGRGTATLWVHVVRDNAGEIVSGSVDFNVRYTVAAGSTITAMHIHSGDAATNGPVVIDSRVTSFASATGAGSIANQGVVAPGNTAGLNALRGLLQNPERYYLNMHTAANPAGVMRGQLEPAKVYVWAGLMSSANEVPALTGAEGSATGSVILIAAQKTDGTITSAEVWFDVNYSGFPAGTNFTGLHVHRGAAGVNGPVVINSALSGQVAASATGAGNLHYEAEVPVDNVNALAAMYGLMGDPSAYYINLHTSAFPGGVVRAQLRRTDRMTWQTTLSPANEVPPIAGLDASAVAAYTMNTIRNNDGAVVGGVAWFDVNYVFPGEVTLRGMHIHNGKAGENGGVTIDSSLTAANAITSTGRGNLFRIATLSSAAALAAATSVAATPENHYLNVHTSVNTGGAVRGQLSAPPASGPVVVAVISANSDPQQTTVARGGLMTIFGVNLTRMTNDGAGFDSAAPLNVNGTTVTVGGKGAAIVVMGREPSPDIPDYIVAQIPPDADLGVQPVVVRHAGGASQPANVTVDAVAPALYLDRVGGLVFHATDFSLVRPDSPAVAGELVGIVSTGLGVVTPALAVGQFAGLGNLTGTVTVRFNSAQAAVQSSMALPGMAGLYLTVAQVPAGVSGTASVTLSTGGKTSNAVSVAVR